MNVQNNWRLRLNPRLAERLRRRKIKRVAFYTVALLLPPPLTVAMVTYADQIDRFFYLVVRAILK